VINGRRRALVTARSAHDVGDVLDCLLGALLQGFRCHGGEAAESCAPEHERTGSAAPGDADGQQPGSLRSCSSSCCTDSIACPTCSYAASAVAFLGDLGRATRLEVDFTPKSDAQTLRPPGLLLVRLPPTSMARVEARTRGDLAPRP